MAATWRFSQGATSFYYIDKWKQQIVFRVTLGNLPPKYTTDNTITHCRCHKEGQSGVLDHWVKVEWTRVN
ncbi:hypothetical protein E2C01_085245 [Portunus trituberculatus]|uniref:Uncharacterized protein n=1 Tax=Portunus trituberculatus TaxID=210409 RepID=A0A5B7JBE5_PORTR|nr:hypothetical protein [Portunus trituberculatus]